MINYKQYHFTMRDVFGQFCISNKNHFNLILLLELNAFCVIPKPLFYIDLILKINKSVKLSTYIYNDIRIIKQIVL